MNCCEILRINGRVTHEIGCRNQGINPPKPKQRYYVGLLEGGNRKFFSTSLEPSRHYFPEYVAVIGAFKTKRAAKWASENPFNWSTVKEAEFLARRGMA